MISVRKFETFCDTILRAFDRPLYAVLVAWLYILAVLSQAFYADPDLFARVAMGRLVAIHGHVPLHDPFAFTPKKEFWIDHEWLSGVVFYTLSQHGGDIALFLFKICLCFISTWFLLRASLAVSDKKTPGLFWLLLLISSNAYLWMSTVRSQVFTYLFLPVSFLAFALKEKDNRGGLLWILPPVMAVWSNSHGGFVVGLGFHFIFAAISLTRGIRYALVPIITLALSFLATFINPYGPIRYWEFILHAVTMDRPTIGEWSRTPLMSGWAFVPGLFVLLLAVGMARRCRHNWFAYILLPLTLYYGYRHRRLIGIFTMVSYVFGRPYLDSALAFLGEKCGRLYTKVCRSGALVLLCGLPVILVFIGTRPEFNNFALDYSAYPVSALEWLYQKRAGVRDAGTWSAGGADPDGGKLLVDFNKGSYALWRLYPKYQISLDGRYEEVYPNTTLKLVKMAMGPEKDGHSDALRAIDPDYILLSAEKYNPERVEKFGREWHRIYQDSDFLILGREEEDSAETPISVKNPWESRF